MSVDIAVPELAVTPIAKIRVCPEQADFQLAAPCDRVVESR